MEILVETAGESTEQTDVLEMIRENWREIGVKLFPKPSQREPENRAGVVVGRLPFLGVGP